jgi:hypothetical protein
MSEPTPEEIAAAQQHFWCHRCLARTEEEAFTYCDGSGFEDDGRPPCRSWCIVDPAP